MRLADFIELRLQEVLAEWETFAATRLPSAAHMNALALRDHAPQILRAIAVDLRQAQSAAEQSAKSQGLVATMPGAPHTAAETHGALRAQHGFSMPQLLSEYRALRASVLRLWAKTNGGLSEPTAADDVMRFNEAVDQAIAESVDYFSQELTQERIERAATDRAFALNRTRLEYASRISRVGFWYCDLPFDVLEWDEQVKEHFFFEPAAKITIEDFYDRIHPEDREPTRSAIAASISSRDAYDIVYRTVHPATAEVKWIRALGGTDYASDGTPIHFDGITVDVSAQKLDEKRVAESEARHRGVLTNMDEAFTLFDEDFNVIEVNDSACRLAGFSRSELLGFSHWQRFPGTHDSDLGRMYRQVLSDGQPGALEHHYVFEDGRRCWFEVRAFMVGPGVAVLFRDVTERREMIEALHEADRRKDEFLAMLAHELRNPLAPITTAGEILSRIPEPDASVAAATAIIRRQAKHMTRLVEDLLDVARVTQGRIHLQQARIDMADVVAQAVETCESQLQAKQQRLTVSAVEPTALYVEGDAARLVQCVANVIGNAIKYTDAKGDIEVRLRGEAADVVIEVADTGTGIAPELLPHIFDLFVQSDRTLDRSEGGLGVGLAVVKRLIDMHGGQVRAFSRGTNLGTTFELRLPRIAAPEAGVLQAGVEQAEAEKPSSRRVLVVDDNVDAAELLVLLLEVQGHILMAVHSAREALACIESFRPDVMLIDIGLPEIDGYELARRLGERALPHGLRKIALTGYGQPEDKLRSREAGFDDHLVKPVDVDTLERAIAGLS